jgi:hypothetical protein
MVGCAIGAGCYTIWGECQYFGDMVCLYNKVSVYLVIFLTLYFLTLTFKQVLR